MSEEVATLSQQLREERRAKLERERDLLRELVSLLDGLTRLEKAVATEELCGKATSVATRFGLVRRRLLSTLEREGVVQVDSAGHPANGEIHEIVDARRSEEPAGTILDVEREAYLHGGSVLRPGRVVVSSGPD